MGRLGEAPVFIDDNPNITVMDIRAKARRQKARDGLGLVIVDYLQLMSSRGRVENRQLEVSEISRNLKVLARELEVPVIALSPLSRNLEARADKRPVLADLRESGCMPATTRLTRADTGEEVTLGELVLSQEQPLVWSLDDRWQLTPQRLVRTFPSGVRPVFRLRLRSGYEVDATANHPFRTVGGWTRLDQLEAGDFLAVPRRLPTPLEKKCWDDDEVVLLAHLLGDGSMGPGVKYATADPANKAAVEEAALRRFGISVSGSKVANTWQLWLPSPYRLTHGRHHPVRNWLEPFGLWGARAHDKFVPEEIFGLGDDQVRLFLRHLWATDGSITLTRNGRGKYVTIYYSSTSRRLCNDVRRLLLRLDIRSRLSRGRKAGYRDGWNVRVEGAENLTRFLNLVGSHGQRGECGPEVLRILEDIKTNPNVGDEEPTDLATSDVFWDEIVEVVALGPMPTFDATVEGTHNFIADGVMAHNSIEQDADVVMFIYRDEVYNPESADRGTAEVLVAKHRNGPTGKTELAFLGQYTRFANMARL
jgi:replicative DNA helicase